MHQAQRLADLRLGPAIFQHGATNVALDAPSADALRDALVVDSDSYLYSGLVTLGDALRGIESSLFTWPTVKLYYVAFYVCRAILGYHNRAVLYLGGKPFSLTCSAGQHFVKRKGSSHKVVLDLFATELASSVLMSQQIDLSSPFLWLMEKREQANYKHARFIEPETPEHFQAITRFGLRRALASYVGDSTHLYAFDPDHAVLAFPVLAIEEAIKVRRAMLGDSCFDAADQALFKRLFADRSGTLAPLMAMLG